MNKNFLTVVKGNLNSLGFVLKKNSPEILIVAGAIGTVAAAVMACRATLKVPELLEDAQIDLGDLHSLSEDGEQFTEKEFNKEVTKVYIKTGLKLVKLYSI